MNRFVCFLIVGLAVIALQATTVEAQGGDPNMPPSGVPGRSEYASGSDRSAWWTSDGRS